jgi:hypothetical protein
LPVGLKNQSGLAFVRSPQETERNLKWRRSGHRGKYPGGAARSDLAGAAAIHCIMTRKPRRPRRGQVWEGDARSQTRRRKPCITIWPVEATYPPKSVVSDRSKLPAAIAPSTSRLRGFGRSVPETTPRRFDLGVAGSVASRPHLRGRFRKPRDVETDDGTGCAVNKSPVPGGIRARRQPKANGSNASPT